MVEPQRYFIGVCVFGEEYLIPFDKHMEWNEWVDRDEFDGSVPDYAKWLPGGQILTFTNPEVM